jgi:beta-glucosidase
MPPFENYSMANRTYRFYRGEPLYPFGYGLSYARCEVLGLTGERNVACVKVKNTGDRDTQEVIELYLKDEDSPLAPPNPVLCGFRRIRLAAGEETEFKIPIDPEAFTVVNEAGERIPGSGKLRLWAGFGGPDVRTEFLTDRKALSILL